VGYLVIKFDLWLLRRCLRGLDVCSIYCIKHLLHVIRYVMLLVEQFIFALMRNFCLFAVAVKEVESQSVLLQLLQCAILQRLMVKFVFVNKQ